MRSRIPDELLRMTILVVDDLADNRNAIMTLLAANGFENLLEAASGAEVLRVLESGREIDLVLLDIRMPGMDGRQVLDHMKSRAELNAIPVIMVTAVDDVESVIECIEHGADDHLVKPVDEVLLRARVRAGLERKFFSNKERELLAQVRAEKKKSEAVLYDVIPVSVASRLRNGERRIADFIDDVTVVFADIVGFTHLSSRIAASELVELLNRVFHRLDQLAGRHGLEKIKTIGDAYLVVGGISPHAGSHEGRCMRFALEAIAAVESLEYLDAVKLQLRVGMHTGPVVAGIIGETRYVYDVWGETVNIASRMESQGMPGRVQVTAETRGRLKHRFDFESRGPIEVKGVGQMPVFLCLSGQRNCRRVA
ncbi:MAG TPA: adenylate/guanylate cyclase domain-containing protein [Gammaproteobacteria bacterium]|nr:adenylate/guanylate cyclase domain-containing protein [Gammaproteobacteria bacterium]